MPKARFFILGSALLALACGGNGFSATSGTSGSGGASSGSGGSAANGGSSTGGASAGASTAGSGGKPATNCTCAAGSYCQGGANKCRSCSDFSRLEFAAPEKLATLSQTGTQRFPRVGSMGTDLFYRSGPAGSEKLWYTTTPLSGTGSALFAMTGSDSAPLLAPGKLQGDSAPPSAAFYFDRLNLKVTPSVRQIWAGTWSGSVTGEAAAPAPLNPASGSSDFSIALTSPDVGRAYWMSTRNAKPAAELVWGPVGGPTISNPSVLDLQVQSGTSTCHRAGDDATPWVNAAGTLLLFRNPSVNDTCVASDSGAFDLFAVPLTAEGLAASAGIALSALNNTGSGSTETDPSLSADSCLVYFASDGGTGDFDLYRAARD